MSKRIGRPRTAYSRHIEHVTVTPEMAEAVTLLQRMSGLSKVAIVRQALAEHLVRLGLMGEQDLPPTLTTTREGV